MHLAELERFVVLVYEPRDVIAMKIAEPYQSETDQEVLIYGIIEHFQENIIRFFRSQNINQEKIAHI